jgi:hypothetical protein
MRRHGCENHWPQPPTSRFGSEISISATHAAKDYYDIQSLRLQGSHGRLNFPFGIPWPEDVAVDCHVGGEREALEDRERLEAKQADGTYMEMLRTQHLKLIEEERDAFEIYQAAVALVAGLSLTPTVQRVPVIDLSFGNDTNNLVKKALDKIFSSNDEGF